VRSVRAQMEYSHLPLTVSEITNRMCFYCMTRKGSFIVILYLRSKKLTVPRSEFGEGKHGVNLFNL
jgi:hypothetical protein